jgi:biotin operon repressor
MTSVVKWDAKPRKHTQVAYPQLPAKKLDSILKTKHKEVVMKASLSETARQVLAIIGKRRMVSLVEIANVADLSPAKTEEAIKQLIKAGYNIEVDPNANIELSRTMPKKSSLVLSTKDYFGDDWIRFGFVADTHLASKYARLDVLNALYDIYEKEGIHTVYHGGNWVDGECRFNKYDVYTVGVENQIDYFLKNYPQRKNIKTYIISGDDHEGWWVQREGVNVGRLMQDRAVQAGRHDLIDLGYMERDIVFKKGSGQSIIRVIHAGGGSAYATSYTSQKYAESLQGGEKPSMVLVGHYHKFSYDYPREIHIIQGGTTQDQTPFMRKKKIQAMVGGCLIEIKQDNKGCFVRVRVEWFPFYDKKFYEYKWK